MRLIRKNMYYPVMPIYRDSRPLKADPILTGVDTVADDATYHRPVGGVDWLIILTTSGKGEAVHPDVTLSLSPGDVILYTPGTPFEYTGRSKRGWGRAWALFAPRPHWLDWFDWPAVADGLMLLHLEGGSLAGVGSSLEAAHACATSGLRQKSSYALNALEKALLQCDQANPIAADAHIDARVQRVLEYIGDHLSQPMALDDLAHAASLSEAHLCRLFREQVGLTPMQCVEERRLTRAAEMLQLTPRPIADIAREVGYDDPFYFSNRFKKMMGVGPRGYRKQGGTDRSATVR